MIRRLRERFTDWLTSFQYCADPGEDESFRQHVDHALAVVDEWTPFAESDREWLDRFGVTG